MNVELHSEHLLKSLAELFFRFHQVLLVLQNLTIFVQQRYAALANEQQHQFLRAVAQGEAQGDGAVMEGGMRSFSGSGGTVGAGAGATSGDGDHTMASMASFNQLPFTLDSADLKRYVQLMAEYEPHAVYNYLSKHQVR